MLLAMRAQIEAMHATVSAALSVLLPQAMAEAEAGCRHPPDQRLNTTVNGGPDRFFCKACHQEFETKAT